MQYKKRPVLKNDSLIERYPRLFSVCFITVCFGMLFSRPIYDLYTGFKLYMKEREMAKKYQLKKEILDEE